jgi:hypothetical protein
VLIPFLTENLLTGGGGRGNGSFHLEKILVNTLTLKNEKTKQTIRKWR